MPRLHAPRTRVSTYLSDWMPTGDTTRQSVAGYWMGGAQGAILTSGEKFTFASQTNAATPNALPAGAQQGQSGSSNSGVAGYLYGSTNRTIIQKILFSTDATSNLVAVLSAVNRQSTGFSNYSVAGYCAGGYNEVNRLNTFERLAFPAETSSTLGVFLTAVTSNQPASFGNRNVAGYVAGGNTSSGVISRIDKLTFPAEVKSTLSDTLTTAKYSISGGFTNDQVAGYVAGGYDTDYSSTVDKIALSTDVKSTTTSMLVAKAQIGAYADAGVAGYYCGGLTSTSWTRNIVKNTFPSDTVSDLGNILVATAREDTAAGFSNEGVF